VELYPSEPVINVSDTERIAFYSWSNGSTAQQLVLNVTQPFLLHANFKKQYLTTFQAVNINGTPVPAANFVVDNNTVNSPQFLYSDVPYDVIGAQYAGFRLPVNKNFSINSSSTVYVQLPLYPVDIVTTDIFGRPVNASAELQLENGSKVVVHTGASGAIELQNVPYGSAVGSAVFSGINESISASNGATVHLFFISNFDIEVFVVVIIIVALLYIIVSRTILKHNKQIPGRPQPRQ